ncbi:hypothetical protein Chor_010793 [Crotalus horridus]
MDPNPRIVSFLAQVTFEDVAIYFSREEWEELSEGQRELYQAVMMENYEAVLSLGLLRVTPQIINQIERKEAVVTGELWQPCKWTDPQGQWPGDGIAMVDEGEGRAETGSPAMPTGKRKKGRPRTANPVPKPENKGPPRVTLKMNPPKCPECGKSFLSNVAMTIHIRTHTGERPFKCHLCPKAFPSRGDLKRHIKTHLRRKPSPPLVHRGETLPLGDTTGLTLQKVRAKEKPYECPQCQKRFRNKKIMLVHQKTHKDEVPQSAPLQSKRDPLVAERKAPRAGHGAGRKRKDAGLPSGVASAQPPMAPIACADCGRRFTQRKYLTLHQRSHR